jgi:Protein of unknown function (DUF3631)
MTRTSRDVAGAQIVALLENTFRKYVAMDQGLPLVLALWTVATHLFDCFDAFPYLAITSPTMRCGKTRLAEIIELLSCNGQRIVGATPAAIFRMIQMYELDGGTVTLILDEAEVLSTKSDRSEALREILNAGYRRGQTVPRCERTPDSPWEVRSFSVYSPKVIVLIGNLNDTLADRCIPIAMRRRKPGENVERFFYSKASREAKRFSKELENWAKTNRRKVKSRHRQDLEFLEDREAELWIPLFSVCAVAAPERLDHLKAIAIGVSRSKQADEPGDMGLLLLRDTRAVFNRAGEDRLSTARLLAQLNSIEENPWANWSHGRGLDPRSLARLLRPFRVQPYNMRFEDNQIARGYNREDFTEAWADYLPQASNSHADTETPESSDSVPPASAT